jgi:hypothetical protein
MLTLITILQTIMTDLRLAEIEDNRYQFTLVVAVYRLNVWPFFSEEEKEVMKCETMPVDHCNIII